jgi:hypothetical protein
MAPQSDHPTTTPRGAGTGPNENEGQREGKGIAETRTRTDVLACSSRSPAGDAAAAVASAPGAAAGAGAPVMAGEAKGERGRKRSSGGVEQSRPPPDLGASSANREDRGWWCKGKGRWAAYKGRKDPKVGRAGCWPNKGPYLTTSTAHCILGHQGLREYLCCLLASRLPLVSHPVTHARTLSRKGKWTWWSTDQ